MGMTMLTDQPVISLPQASALLRASYRITYDRALKGDFGEVCWRGNRIFVTEAAVKAAQQPAGPPMALPPELADLYEPIERFHKLNVAAQGELVAILADASAAEQARDFARAKLLRELVRQLQAARYSWDEATGRWTMMTFDGQIAFSTRAESSPGPIK
jgi:hypothetical protein